MESQRINTDKTKNYVWFIENILVPLCLGGLLSVPAYPQGTVEDYNRAYNLREKYSAKHVLYSNVVPHWVEDTDVFWYIRNTARGKEYIKVDAKQSKRSALFDQKSWPASWPNRPASRPMPATCP